MKVGEKPKLLVSFSGGKTSGMMCSLLLEHCADEYELKFVFANTGQEREETLEFVQKCDEHFGLDLVWVEAVIHYPGPGQRIPTPTAQDHIERVSTSSEKLNFQTNKSVSLDRWVRMWPTPKAQPSGPDFARANGQGSGGDDLATAVARLWPTASSRDYKDTPGMSKTGTNPDGSLRKREDQLPRAVFAEEQRMHPTPDVGAAKGRGEKSAAARGRLGGSLNPTWVEWLMGFPIGWTDLNASETQ